MKIVVCMKQVPDTEAHIKIKAGTAQIETEGISMVVNPYDEFAVEEALRIKEKLGTGEVTILSLGPAKAKEAQRTCLAMGADKAVHLADAAFDGLDNYGVANALAKAIKGLEPDLILCGKQAVDDDAAQVGPMLAEILNLPQATVVTKLELDAANKKATATRQIEGGSEIIELPLPAVVTAQKGLNEPRYPSLKGIMSAKKKEIAEMNAAGLGLTAEELTTRTKTVSLTPPPTRAAGKVLQGEPAEVSAQVVKLLREEAKAI